ncbi:MAG: polyphosphate polymerase domain-containing protein [Halieaceae bacterium]|jgi:hypothetical protein|nr:polyphosphate polymerase domain-containing protein [Halieaceae bacterium]
MALVLDQKRYCSDHARIRLGTHEVEATCMPVLQKFSSHSLTEQLAVNLADRTDSKYLMPIRALSRFLQALIEDHTVLQSAEHRIFTYENTYFDTPGWDMYLRHHNGKLNRRKLRFRRYHETDISYLEVKLKNNKQRTVKTRILWDDEKSVDVPTLNAQMEARLYVNYRRITLWNRLTDERLTLDYDLHFLRPGQGKAVQLSKYFIAEIKREGKVYGSSFFRNAKNYGFTPLPISKYCVGVCLTDSGELKRNRFKPLLKKLSEPQHSGELVG